MMKRSKLKYRFQGKNLTIRDLYALVKRRMKCKKGQRFRTFSLIVDLNLSENTKDPEWISVKLLFGSPKKSTKDGWVVLLSTDISLESEKILQIYTLRWGIEVYFKEVKQNMGFLKEQTGRYVCHYASVNLAAIRYMLFFHLFLSRNGMSFGNIRDTVTGKLELLSFAALLWELFRALIFGALDQIKDRIGSRLLLEIKKAIGDKIENFLFEALQIDSKSIKAQLKAENLGLI